MWKKSRRDHNTFLSFSPWILGAACLLLLLFLALFAVKNYQRERKLITTGLEQKGLTLVRFINSSVRESIRTSLRSREEWQSWQVHMQAALEQAVEQPGVERVVVLDSSGKTLLAAQSKSARLSIDIGVLARTELFHKLSKENSRGWSSLLFEDESNHDKAFLVAAFHKPPKFPWRGPRNGMQRRARHHEHYQDVIDDIRRIKEVDPAFVVQLDFDQFSGPLKKQFLQIVLQLVVILLVGIGGTLSFLTLRGLKGTEKSLGDVRAFNDHMVASIPIGVLASDADGLIRTLNRAVCRILSIDGSGVEGSRLDEVLPREMAEVFSTMENEGKGELDVEVKLVVGERMKTLNLIASSVPYGDGETSGKVILVRDLTQVKELEDELQRSERLAALGKMAAGVAHELRNPLSSIKGLALLLKPHFQKGSVEANNTETLVKEVDRLNRGITELLDFARPTKLSKEYVNIEEIVRKTLHLIEADAGSYEIAIDVTVEENLKPILLDSDKISQVLLNVFLNAIQAMYEKNRGIKGVLSVKLKEHNGHLIIKVRDNGKGIAPHEIEKVFDPYYTTKSNGTGLGLALSAKIIEEHGGKIEITSVLTEYAEVDIYLPVQIVPETPHGISKSTKRS